jgi:hypothetical protein
LFVYSKKHILRCDFIRERVMSNYIMLIMYAYNEKEEKEEKEGGLKPKINLLSFFNENKSLSVALIMAVISLISYIVLQFIKINNVGLYRAISIILYTILVIILIPLSEKSVQKNYKRNIEKYDLRLEILRNILRYDFKLYEPKKIEELVKQCDLSIESYKLSTETFKPLVGLTKSVLFPIITFSFGLIIKKVKISVDDTIRITALVVIVMLMFLVLFYIIKHTIESFLDNQSNKIKRLKGMLNDMRIKDFIKEKKI